VGTGAVCRNCNVARRHVVETRPWSNAAKSCAEWTEQQVQQARLIIPHEMHQKAQQAAQRLEADGEVARLVRASSLQVALAATWEDEETGLSFPLRAMVTYLPEEGAERDDCIGSLTTTHESSPSQWASWAYSHGLHVQAAFKQDLCAGLAGGPRPEHLWVLVESEAPFLVGRRRTTPEMLTAGRNAYEALLRSYAQCLASGTWPAFDPERPGSLNAWSPFHLEPWMTQGDGKSDRYFAVNATTQLKAAA
jgi:hypothetical protein